MRKARSQGRRPRAVEGERTEENTLVPYNEMLIHIYSAWGLSGVMSNLHPDKSVRDVGERMEQELSSFYTDMSLNRDLYVFGLRRIRFVRHLGSVSSISVSSRIICDPGSLALARLPCLICDPGSLAFASIRLAFWPRTPT